MNPDDNNTISQDISYFFNRDKETDSFYDLINPFLSQLYENELYKFVEDKNDILTISEVRPFPDIVQNAITPVTNRVYFGIISKLSRFYCIIDNSIYFWSTNADNKDTVEFYIEEESTMISCVYGGRPNPDAFYENKIIGVILYATDVHMKIVPVTEKMVCFELSKTIKLKFIPTAFYTTKSGTIFIASFEGYIYSLIYKFNPNTGKLETKIKNLTIHKFLQFLDRLPITISLFPRIVQMVVDEETQILASLDDKSVLKFYKISEDKLIYLSEFNPKDSDGKYKNFLTTITSVPLNNSNSIKFVGFQQDGTQLCFFVDQYLDIVNPSSLHSPPPIETEEPFFDAFISPSFCIYLYEKAIVVARESHNANEFNYIAKETYCTVPFDTDVLSFSQFIPDIQPTKLSNHPFFWQHLFPPNPGYLINSDGIRTINFLMPMDILSKIFDEEEKNRIFFSTNLENWAKTDYLEATATALLLAEKKPKYKNRCFHFILKAIEKSKKKDLPDQTDIEIFEVVPFFVRVTRILSPIWSDVLFKKIKDDEYEFSEGFKKPPLNYIKEIKQVKSLCDEYYKFIISLNHPQTKDIGHFPLLSSYLDELIGILRFIKIIKKIENAVLNQILNTINAIYTARLFNIPFGYDQPNSPLYENLPKRNIQSLGELFHGFSMQLYEISPESEILILIEKKCPQFFVRSDVIVRDSIQIIQKKFDNSDGAISNAVNVLIHYISRPMNHYKISEILKDKKCFNLAFKLCMAKVDEIDPKKLASHWFNFDRSNADPNLPGVSEFDKIYRIYEIIFGFIDLDSDSDVDAVLSTEDAMFQSCFYHNLYEKRLLKKILSKKAPHLKRFIQETAPKYLWRYLAAHKKYNQAAIELWNYIDQNNDICLSKRIKLLKTCVRFSFENITLKNDVKTMLKLGEIQLDLLDRTKDEENFGFYIFDSHDLFIECSDLGFWDLSLRILSNAAFNVEKKFPITRVWEYFFVEYLHGPSLPECNDILRTLFASIDLNSDVAKLELIVPLFENFKLEKKAPKYWVFRFFLKAGYNVSKLAKIYFDLSNDEYLEDEIKCSFVDIFALAVTSGARFEEKKIVEKKNWFFENAKSYRDYEDVLKTFDSIL